MDLKHWKVFQHLDPVFASDVKRAYLVCEALEDMPAGAGVLVMKNGDVYSIALTPDDVAVLGASGAKDLTPLVPVKLEALCGQEIKEISSGDSHVAVLTTAGRIYQWGMIALNESSDPHELEPKFLSGVIETERVVQVTCGDNHTLALTSEGDVFSWGCNSSGQLGALRREHELDPEKITGTTGINAEFSSVACTGNISCALDNNGKVWFWGNGDDGHDVDDFGYATTSTFVPTMIWQLDCCISQIAAASTGILALSTSGDLYLLEWVHQRGQFGAPTKIKVPKSETVVEIGATHSCPVYSFKTCKGKVYFWGYAYGHHIKEPVRTRFTSIPDLFASLDTPKMLKPLEVDLKRSITDKLKLSFDDKETADVTFRVEGKLIHAHRLILKLRNDYFRRMFDNDWKENAKNVIEIPDFEYASFCAFLLYLYTDRIEPLPRTAEEAIKLFKLADFHGEEDLETRCVQQLKLLITENNFSQVYSTAVQHNSTALHNIAIDFAVPCLNLIFKTEDYDAMADELKNRFIKELADEDVFVGLKRKKQQQ